MQPNVEITSSFIGLATAGFLSLLGVPPYTLVWGLIGAVFMMLVRTSEVGRFKAFGIVLVSAAIAAAFGMLSGEWTAKPSRAMITVVCIVTGFGAQAVLSALVSVGVERIQNFAGRPGVEK